MTTKAAAKPAKVVYILGRAEFKKNGYILYRVQAEVNGVRHEKHDVTVVDGKVTSCTDCKSWQFNRKCCHTDRVREAEAERVEMEHRIDQDLDAHIIDEAPYPTRLSREAYCSEFQVYNQE